MLAERRRSTTRLTHSTPKLTRRLFLTGGAAAGAALAAGGPLVLGARQARGADQLVWISWGGTTQEAQEKTIVKAFQEETGIQVISTSGPDLAKLKAQVKTGNIEWDVVNLPGPMAVGAEREGLLEKIDRTVVDVSGVFFGVREHTMAWYTYPGGIVYDPKRHPAGKHPRSWPQFWDAKAFPGRRGLRNRPDEILEIALMGDGVPPKKLYPLDVERAFRALERIKPHVTKWTVQTPQTITLIQTNEIDFVYSYSGRVEAAKKQGLSVEFVYESTLVTPSYIAVPKGTKNHVAAMKLVNYFLRPDLQAAYCNLTGYGPIKRAAMPLLTPEAKAQQADLDSPNTAVTNVEWWVDNYTEISKRFKEFLINA